MAEATTAPLDSKSVPEADSASDFAIEIQGLDFKYKEKVVLDKLNLKLRHGSRCLLTGDNGAGKTTLLRILGGKHHVPEEKVRILGRQGMFSPELNVLRSYLGGDWGKRTVAFVGFGVPMTADLAVNELMTDLQKEFPVRRKKLYDLLNIDENWRMNIVSDGQRRRVQIMLGLLRPFKLLLLDEITTDLDVVTRQDLLAFLKEETELRGVTVVYATHIFDGLDNWPTHVMSLHDGKAKRAGTYADVVGKRGLLTTVAEWIRADRKQSKAEKAKLAVEKTVSNLIVPDGTAGGYTSGRLARFMAYC